MKIKVIIISVITCLLVVGSVGGVFAFNSGKKKTSAPEIIGKGSYTIWLYSEHGKINGIPKAVDLCRFRKGYGVKDIMM